MKELVKKKRNKSKIQGTRQKNQDIMAGKTSSINKFRVSTMRYSKREQEISKQETVLSLLLNFFYAENWRIWRWTSWEVSFE
jgi:hypothetical protein